MDLHSILYLNKYINNNNPHIESLFLTLKTTGKTMSNQYLISHSFFWRISFESQTLVTFYEVRKRYGGIHGVLSCFQNALWQNS